jgi:hypothetical protein
MLQVILKVAAVYDDVVKKKKKRKKKERKENKFPQEGLENVVHEGLERGRCFRSN